MAKVLVSDTLKADASAVWSILGDFGGMQVGGPITAVDVDGDGVGMVRTITMGGPKVVERLEAYDDAAMSLKYAIINDDCPLPVSDYSATIDVKDNGDGSCSVAWEGTFEPKGVPEEQASEIVKGIYAGGIAGAKQATGG
jgi:hypothetical protein